MKYRTRIYYTEEQKSCMWDRWQKGDSLHTIARLFDRSHGSIAGILSRTGGIRPKPRTRSCFSLTLTEREDISRGIAAELSIRTIATKMDRSPSTVSREINRNGGYCHYRAAQAEHKQPGIEQSVQNVVNWLVINRSRKLSRRNCKCNGLLSK